MSITNCTFGLLFAVSVKLKVGVAKALALARVTTNMSSNGLLLLDLAMSLPTKQSNPIGIPFVTPNLMLLLTIPEETSTSVIEIEMISVVMPLIRYDSVRMEQSHFFAQSSVNNETKEPESLRILIGTLDPSKLLM